MSPVILVALLVIDDKGMSSLASNELRRCRRIEGIGDVRRSRHTFGLMSGSPTIVPWSMGCDKTIQWLMLADTFDECVTRCLIIAALDAKVCTPWFDD